MMENVVLVFVAVAGVVIGLGVLVLLSLYFRLWLRAFVSRAQIGMLAMAMMSLRKIRPQIIVDAKVMAVQAGLTRITTRDLEGHFLAGGNVRRVIKALIASHRAGIELDWNTATAIDLAGRDVLDAVQMSVHPRIIDCPNPNVPGSKTLDGIAKDGIQLKATARVTVRANLARLVGGATEETVIARVGEGIVSAIGSCETHRDVLKEPMRITRRVLERGLDSQTAFEIVSIDIADIDVAENVGARLQADQAEADMRVAQAKAEVRRARAVAREQEMQAETVENRAKVVEAEAEIPKAEAQAFRDGNLGTRADGEHRLQLPMDRQRRS